MLKALGKDPHKRFAHVLEFASALKQAGLSEGCRPNLPVGAAGVVSCRAVSPYYTLGRKVMSLVEPGYVYTLGEAVARTGIKRRAAGWAFE